VDEIQPKPEIPGDVPAVTFVTFADRAKLLHAFGIVVNRAKNIFGSTEEMTNAAPDQAVVQISKSVVISAWLSDNRLFFEAYEGMKSARPLIRLLPGTAISEALHNIQPMPEGQVHPWLASDGPNPAVDGGDPDRDPLMQEGQTPDPNAIDPDVQPEEPQ
jgi:hypothetical protein